MSKPNLKSQAKRKRELAKLDKRQAKEQKRAERKAERAGSVDAIVTPVAAPTPQAAKPVAPGARVAAAAPGARVTVVAPVQKPLTLAAAVLQWKMQRIPKTKAR